MSTTLTGRRELLDPQPRPGVTDLHFIPRTSPSGERFSYNLMEVAQGDDTQFWSVPDEVESVERRWDGQWELVFAAEARRA